MNRISRVRGFLLGIRSFVGSLSVPLKLTAIVQILILLFGLGVTVQVRAILTGVLTRTLEEHGRSLALDLAARGADSILTNNLFALHELVRETSENNRDVRYAFFLSPGREVLAHSLGGAFPVSLISANFGTGRKEVHLEVLETEEGVIWDFAVPVFEGRAGTARLGISLHRLQETVASVTKGLVAVTLILALVGMGCAFGLTRIVTRPIAGIVEATRAVARGDLDAVAPESSGDEIGALGGAFNRMVDDLKSAKEEVERKEGLRLQLLRKVITAQEEERKRLARELHDQIGQALTTLLVELKLLGEEAAHAEIGTQTARLRDRVGQILDDVRSLARELRPSVLDDLGLAAALERYVQDYAQRFNLTVDFQTVGLNRCAVPPQTAVALYRIIQEAMTNVARHADAESVSLLVEYRSGVLLAVIEDNGKGFSVDRYLNRATQEQSLGLFGMQERASLLGGRVTIESVQGKGTSIFAEIPLEPLTTKELENRDDKNSPISRG